ncbi:MAG: hypothetical protein AAGI03_02305 [Pseudomonadota bacterium]
MIVFLLLVAGAGYGWWITRDPDALRAAAAEKTLRAEQELGIRQMLNRHDTFAFENILLDMEGPDGMPEFRGQIRSQEALVAAYGQIRGLCEADFAQGSCWEIALLEADGRSVELSTAPEVAVAPTSETETTQTTQEAGAAPQTAAVTGAPATAEAGEEATAPSEQPEATSETPTTEDASDSSSTAEAGPQPTHRVTRPRINSRSGPGTNNQVVTQLTEDTPLGLLESRDGWGQFTVMGGPSEGSIVWIALSLTAPL